MKQAHDNVGHLLDELSRDWHVELTAGELTDSATIDRAVWRLTIIPRRPRRFGSFTYRGDLLSVITRAWSGQPPDSISR